MCLIQLSDLVQWIRDILHTTSTANIQNNNSDSRVYNMMSDGKEDNHHSDDICSKPSSKSVADQVDGLMDELQRSHLEGKKDGSSSSTSTSTSIPYRIEYIQHIPQTTIPSIIIHYTVPKEL